MKVKKKLKAYSFFKMLTGIFEKIFNVQNRSKEGPLLNYLLLRFTKYHLQSDTQKHTSAFKEAWSSHLLDLPE